MRRVVVLGRGAAGKSTLAARLGAATGIPVVELDALFWGPDLTPTPPAEWVSVQRELVARPAWIADGDLGPYDVLDLRLAAADTVVLLDFPLVLSAWRAVRRSRERSDFWRWVVTYRRRRLPLIRLRIEAVAPTADLHVLRNPRAVRGFLDAHGR